MQNKAGRFWFATSQDVQKTICDQFKMDLDAIENNERDHWINDRDGVLAYIICCD